MKTTGSEVSSVYFIGIGGIGMSALARYFHSKGARVSGYDKTRSSLTASLEKEGIKIHFEENENLIPKEAELVVYTPAIPKDHRELVFYQQHGYPVVKRSEVLQKITESSFNICVAGTHGKTTISTMIGHLLRHSGYGCTAFLGGISVNYETNFWSIAPEQSPAGGNKNVCVIEADEYDRSFLKLSPDIALITAMDADHLDIYGTEAAVETAFIEFSRKTRKGGLLVSKYGLKRTADLFDENRITYSLQDERADAFAGNIRMENGSYVFNATIKENKIGEVRLNMGGTHNVENAIAAMTVASSLGMDYKKISEGVETFRGVKRRFEYIIKNPDFVFIDDYAHHPEELRALISGAKSLFREKKCTIIFQPHLYTRTKDLADGFASVLSLADAAILLPVYPARELPIEGVNSEMILKKMTSQDKRVMSKEEWLEWLKNDYAKQIRKHSGQVLITAGAGDIDTLLEQATQILTVENK